MILENRESATQRIMIIAKQICKSKFVFIILLAGLFLCMLCLNHMSFYRTDDYAFLFQIMESEKTSPLGIALEGTAHYIDTWSGRPNNFFVFLFLQINKNYFNIFNSALYVLLIILLYAHITGKYLVNNLLLLSVISMAWFFFSDFGNVVLWISAVPGYVLPSVCGLLLLLPFRLYLRSGIAPRGSMLIVLASIPLGILSAGGMETIGGAVIVLSCLYVVLFRIRKMRIPIWAFNGIVFPFLTLCVSMLSSGTQNRQNLFIGGSIIRLLAERMYLQLQNLTQYFVLVFFTLLVVLVLYRACGHSPYTQTNHSSSFFDTITNTSATTVAIAIYLIGSVFSQGALLLSNYLVGRQNFFTICMLIIAIGIAGLNLNMSNDVIRSFTLPLACTLLFLYTSSYAVVFAQTFNAYSVQKTNDANIRLAVSLGITDDVEIVYTELVNSHMSYHPQDLSADYALPGFCKYYGINSIKLIPNG